MARPVRVTVARSGGVAGMSRTWTLDSADAPDPERFAALVAACPWHAAGTAAAFEADPDRFAYRITVDGHVVDVTEAEVGGPWRDLLDYLRRHHGPSQ
ncbi:MAG: hypothetical protein HOQ24_05550 [Mycobacteriaceae bacterium]|nr:hypothetical protein [Mycobacteriaceae bacterium]